MSSADRGCLSPCPDQLRIGSFRAFGRAWRGQSGEPAFDVVAKAGPAQLRAAGLAVLPGQRGVRFVARYISTGEAECQARVLRRDEHGQVVGTVPLNVRYDEQMHVVGLEEPFTAACRCCGGEHTLTLASLAPLVAGLRKARPLGSK